MGDSVSKSSDRLYQGSCVDYKDDSGRWRVGKIVKVDDTWQKEGIVVVCAESREMRYFSMRKKACRERIARPGRYTVPKKEDIFWYSGGHEELIDLPKDTTSHHHDAILGARKNSFGKENAAEDLLSETDIPLRDMTDEGGDAATTIKDAVPGDTDLNVDEAATAPTEAIDIAKSAISEEDSVS